MEFEYKGYTLDTEVIYIDEDGDWLKVSLLNGELLWLDEDGELVDCWCNLSDSHLETIRPLGAKLVKKPVYEIGKYYLMNNGGDSLFKKLVKIEDRHWNDVFVDEDGTRWRGIHAVDPECLGQFE